MKKKIPVFFPVSNIFGFVPRKNNNCLPSEIKYSTD